MVNISLFTKKCNPNFKFTEKVEKKIEKLKRALKSTNMDSNQSTKKPDTEH